MAPPLSDELRGVRAQPARRAPDQHGVALLHPGPVVRDELPVRRGVDQAGAGGLLPCQVRWLGHQLVGLDQCELGQAAEVRLEAPDALLRVEHGVVVAVRALQLDRQAVRDDLVAGLPRIDARARPQHHTGQVGADHVVGQVVPLRERGDPPVPAQELEGRNRLEDRRPDGVVVDGAGHHRHDRLAWSQLGGGHLVEVEALARILLARRDAVEHLRLVGVHRHAPVVVRHGEAGERVVLLGEDGVEDLLHGRPPLAQIVLLGIPIPTARYGNRRGPSHAVPPRDQAHWSVRVVSAAAPLRAPPARRARRPRPSGARS